MWGNNLTYHCHILLCYIETMTKEQKKIFSDGREVKIHSESDFNSMEKAGALAKQITGVYLKRLHVVFSAGIRRSACIATDF